MSYLGHNGFYQFHTESVTSISKFTPKTLGKNLILAASQQLLSVFLPLGSEWKYKTGRQELLCLQQDVMGKMIPLFEIKPMSNKMKL